MGAHPTSPSQALGRGPVRLTRFVGRMYVCELESPTPVYILFSSVNLCILLCCDVILLGEVPVSPVRDGYLCCTKFLRVSCLRIQRGCECEKVSRDTREGGASEESWTLRDSYCMEKYFCYVCTRGWGIRSPRAKKYIVFDQSVCHVCIPLHARRRPVSRRHYLAATLLQVRCGNVQ